MNVHTANEAKAIMAKVLHKFGIDESSADSYCIFVGSSTNGEGSKRLMKITNHLLYTFIIIMISSCIV